MPRYDASSADVLVYSFKEGLLSAVAHDLKLRVTHFHVDEEGGVITAEFDAASLAVVTAMKDGHEAPGLLPTFMHAETEKNIAREVLDARRHALIRFEVDRVTSAEVTGRLALNGVTRSLRGVRRDTPGRRVAEFVLDVRDFGLTPFTAMLGTLRTKPDVKVSVSLPTPDST